MSKIFGIGFHRTGTTSLRDALRILGYKCSRHSPYLYPELRQKIFTSTLGVVNRYDAFQDFPWPLIYKELDRRFPGSKFILTKRDTASWLQSVTRLAGKVGIQNCEDIYGNISPFPTENPQAFIDRYEQHNQKVMAYFKDRPNDLLVLDLNEEAHWVELCSFLGKDIPDAPYPHRNKKKPKALPKKKTLSKKWDFLDWIPQQFNKQKKVQKKIRTVATQKADIPFCIFLGNDQTAADFLGTVFNLHPACQVLHQASDRVLGIPALDVFASYSPPIYQELLKFVVTESVNGAISPFVGFENTALQEAYQNRFGAAAIKKRNKEAIIWNDAIPLLRYIQDRPDAIRILLKKEKNLCLLWIQKEGLGPKTEQAPEWQFFARLQREFPNKLRVLTMHDFGRKSLDQLTNYLQLNPNEKWIDETVIASLRRVAVDKGLFDFTA